MDNIFEEEFVKRFTIISIDTQAPIVLRKMQDKIEIHYWTKNAIRNDRRNHVDNGIYYYGHNWKFICQDVINLEFLQNVFEILDFENEELESHRYLMVTGARSNGGTISHAGAIISRIQAETGQTVIPIRAKHYSPTTGHVGRLTGIRGSIAQQMEIVYGIMEKVEPLNYAFDDPINYIKSSATQNGVDLAPRGVGLREKSDDKESSFDPFMLGNICQSEKE